MLEAKPYDISKQVVWEAYLKVKVSVANIIDVEFADSDQRIRGFGGAAAII